MFGVVVAKTMEGTSESVFFGDYFALNSNRKYIPGRNIHDRFLRHLEMLIVRTISKQIELIIQTVAGQKMFYASLDR